jgi:23S rRNA pseudouridine2605 synthase
MKLPPGTVALERALSKLGVASRTEARALIVAGRVTVDGAVTRNPLQAVVPERAALAVDGARVERQQHRVVALHKRRGTLTTRRDPKGRRTIYDDLPQDLHGLMPVGRLDLATSGLLLLTNDTRLQSWLLEPTSGVVRTYVAVVRGLVTDEDAAQMVAGIDDGGERLAAAHVTVDKRSRKESRITLKLAEGRNREVRRLALATGHEVTRLLRVSYGGIALGALQPGEARDVPPEELARAFDLPPPLRRIYEKPSRNKEV